MVELVVVAPFGFGIHLSLYGHNSSSSRANEAWLGPECGKRGKNGLTASQLPQRQHCRQWTQHARVALSGALSSSQPLVSKVSVISGPQSERHWLWRDNASLQVVSS